MCVEENHHAQDIESIAWWSNSSPSKHGASFDVFVNFVEENEFLPIKIQPNEYIPSPIGQLVFSIDTVMNIMHNTIKG